ncbi:MAG: Gfo/Idh/MocA family oxidoreductase, partial [Eudoraea sp.]
MKRREFVIKSSLATAAIGTTSFMESGMAYSKNTTDSINFGVIGTGDRGGGLINIMNNIPELNVISCCDILPFRLQKGIANTSGKAKGYSDYRKLLEQKDIDAILVATPFNTHSQIASEAIDAGKHVFCEKTMAKGYDGISRLRDKVNSSDKIFQTGHQYHSSRLYRHVVDLI